MRSSLAAKSAVAVLFLLANVFAYRHFGTRETIPPRPTFASLQLEGDSWRCPKREAVSDEDIKTLGLTDYFVCTFVPGDDRGETGDTAWFNLYAGYHERQIRPEGGNETVIHPPEHCLPGSGWDIISSRMVHIDFGIPGEAKRVMIAKGDQRRVVYFWYQSRGRTIGSGMQKIFYMFLDRARTGRSDGSLIRFTFPVDRTGEDAADRTFNEVAAWLMPQLDPFLPR